MVAWVAREAVGEVALEEVVEVQEGMGAGAEVQAGRLSPRR